MQPPPQSPSPRRRPATVEEFRAIVRERSATPLFAPPGFVVRPSDVLIATYPKCGTTWVQQIVHGLRTGGSMDFEEISMVVPWIETAPLLNIDLDAPQVATPRAFKTHLPWHLLPKGGRNIFVTREPGDVIVSFYHFMKGVTFDGDAIDLETFVFELVLAEIPTGRWWEHLRAWWPVRGRDDVLMLCYEDMKDDLRTAVARIAAFCGIDADDALIDLATRQAEYDFMRAHGTQFDDHPTIAAFTKLQGLPPARTTKVRTGRVGDRTRELSPRVVTMLEERWRREIAEPLGLASYEDVRATLRAEAAAAD
ncbi:sulfotransferase domain-containing protein [Haliangium sp.]|uniref:sulfotransferase domain-containing protein n=1 Tax=Haliangium sp. TaxID=2663208 RepID=UPI003D105915